MAQAYGEDAFPLVDGLFALGTAPAIQEAMGVLPRFEKTLKDREKPRRKLARERPQKTPKYWKGSKDAWVEREQSRIAGAVKRFDDQTAKLEDWRLRYAGHLRAAAGKARVGLPESVTGE